MKTLKFVLALLLLLCLPWPAAATQIRGTLLDANGRAMTGAVIEFELGGCSDANGVPSLVNGNGGVLAQKKFTVKPGPGGQVIAQIVGNDQILCGGGTNTWWIVTVKVNTTVVWRKTAVITGGLWNIATGPYLEMEPTDVPQQAVLKNSNYDQIIVVPSGRKLEVQGTFIATVSGNVTGNAATATALAGTPEACTGNSWLKGFTAAGVTTCTQPGFSNLSGSLSASQLPALIGDVTTNAGSATTSLSATGISAGTYTKVTIDTKGRATLGETASSSDLSDGTTLVRTATPQTISATHTFSGALTFSGANTFNAAQTFTQTATVKSGLATDVPLTVQGYTGQSEDLARWLNSSGSTLAKVTKDGYVSAPQLQINGTALASTHLSDSTALVRNNTDQTINAIVTATGFSGPLTGNVTGNLAGNVNGTTVTASGTIQGATVNATSGFQVNGSALTWANLSGKMALTYIANCTVEGSIPKWTSSGGWACAPDNSNATGAVVFTQLSDVPQAYTGQGGKALRVNAGATGLEFYDATGLSSAAQNLWSATQTYSASPVLNNNIPLVFKNASAATVNVLNLNGSNQVVLGGGQILLQPTLGTTLLGLNGTTATVTGTVNATADYQLNGTSYKDATQTFTNKTFNAEATGNVLQLPLKMYAQAAGCEGTAPYSLYDTPASDNPLATCITGTNQQKGVLRYSNAGTLWSEFTFAVPGDQTGSYDVRLLSLPNATSNATWTLSYACTAANATDDPTWTAWSGMTVASSGANGLGVGTLTGVTGCMAGQLMHIKVARTDTTGPTQSDLLGVELTIRRSM